MKVKLSWIDKNNEVRDISTAIDGKLGRNHETKQKRSLGELKW